MVIFAAIPLSSPSPIIRCHCEERSDEASCIVIKTRFNVIQFEVPIITHRRGLSGKRKKTPFDTPSIIINFETQNIQKRKTPIEPKGAFHLL